MMVSNTQNLRSYLTARNATIELHHALNDNILMDYDTITRIVGSNSSDVRREIVNQYKDIYKKDLQHALEKNILTGLYHQVVLSLLMPPSEFYAKQIKECFGMFKTDWRSLVDMLATIEPSVLSDTNKTYMQMYNMSIEAVIKWNISCGYFQRLLVLLALNRRSRDEKVDESLVQHDVDKLFYDDETHLNVNVDVFLHMMTSRSKAHLCCLFKRYEACAGCSIQSSITQEFSFRTQKALIHLVHVIEEPELSSAEELHRCCMLGFGVNNKRLIYLVVTLAESDQLPQIKQLYQEKFDLQLEQSISNKTSGDYRDILLALLQNGSKMEC